MMQAGFQYYKMGRTVGETSAEPLFITGEVNSASLKNSKLKFYFASANFMLPGCKKEERSYYIPDVTLAPGLAERLTKEDAMLEKVKRMIDDNR
jgi:hypothetical protein